MAGVVGKQIRDRRKELGLSQRDLAEPGIAYACISRIEALRTPSLTALIKLAKKLDCTALWLLTGHDDRQLSRSAGV